MRDGTAYRWDVDEGERAGTERAVVRPKPVVRRRPAQWTESDGVFRATIGSFAVTVAPSREVRGGARGDNRATSWEWSAFGRVHQELPRGLGCRGFLTREAAQQDAEISLAELG
ncbi:MAG: hypothetical protein U0359_18995 [Byssovorax sp.]